MVRVRTNIEIEDVYVGPALLSVSSAANWDDLQTGESGDCLFVSGLCVAERESAVDRK